MIHVSVEPLELPVNRSCELIVRLSNAGPVAYTNVVFKLSMPAQLVLLRGSNLIEAARFVAGSISRSIYVRAKQVGPLVLTSKNFSYRDSLGTPGRITDFRTTLTAVPANPVMNPESSLAVTLETTAMRLAEWETLKGCVVNTGPISVHRILVRAIGPVISDPLRPWEELGTIQPGEDRLSH